MKNAIVISDDDEPAAASFSLGIAAATETYRGAKNQVDKNGHVHERNALFDEEDPVLLLSSLSTPPEAGTPAELVLPSQPCTPPPLTLPTGSGEPRSSYFRSGCNPQSRSALVAADIIDVDSLSDDPGWLPGDDEYIVDDQDDVDDEDEIEELEELDLPPASSKGKGRCLGEIVLDDADVHGRCPICQLVLVGWSEDVSQLAMISERADVLLRKSHFTSMHASTIHPDQLIVLLVQLAAFRRHLMHSHSSCRIERKMTLGRQQKSTLPNLIQLRGKRVELKVGVKLPSTK